ncbi:GGDEF domain-containing protein [Alkalimarinus coralli]|uniref:GGDEF domain-containing protein n=1 Tax=Alkalimarinus coralli TaxID=2935863 RepID=UPI00202B62D5|nr:diguanylate cyclase [Alkalimarinus coralli]
MKAMERISKMRQRLLEVSEELEVANVELKRLADVDGLTGLANRRYMDRFLSHEVARCSRSNEPLTVIMCDIDEFKLYNDFYGHLKGDDCIKMIANTLMSSLKRATDLAARFGGEEFALILPNTTEQDANKLAEQVRESVEELNIMHEKSSVQNYITLSMGVYNAIPTKMLRSEDYLGLADKALYHAKQTGRNRVVNYSDIA